MPKGGREQMDSRLAQVLWGEVPPPPSFLCPHKILVGVEGVSPPHKKIAKNTSFPMVLGHEVTDPYQLLWFSMGGERGTPHHTAMHS